MRCDLLMVTHNRPAYTALTLPRLLASCDESSSVWVWHNGDDAETLAIIEAYRAHPRLERFHHSPENVGLTIPTNWLWSNSDADLVGKVDDDYLVPSDWLPPLLRDHLAEPRLGALAAWNFGRADLDEELVRRRVTKYRSGVRLLHNPWVGGTCYVMKRNCVLAQGQLSDAENFQDYCVDLTWRGFINGYAYPVIVGEHMDHPGSEHTMLVTDSCLRASPPLTVRKHGITTLEDWAELNANVARLLLTSKPDRGLMFRLRQWNWRLRGGGRSRVPISRPASH